MPRPSLLPVLEWPRVVLLLRIALAVRASHQTEVVHVADISQASGNVV